MQISLTKHTYIRVSSSRGYIANTRSNKQLVYDEIGASWLKVINNAPISLEEIMLILRKEDVFNQVSDNVLENDLIEFYTQLQEYGFVIIDNKTIDFSTKNTTCKQKLPYVLKSLFFEITDKCNERCIHCYIPENKKMGGLILPFQTFRSIIDEFCLMGGEEVTLSGGEIALHPNLTNMMDYCVSKNLAINLFSNCMLFEETLIKQICKIGVSTVQVSLYSLDYSIHDSITKIPGSCQKTLTAIRTLHQYGVKIRIAVPAMKENAQSIVDILKFAKLHQYDVRVEYSIIAKEDLTTDNLNHRLNLEETERLLREIYLFDKQCLLRYLKSTSNDESEDFDFLKYLNKHICGACVENVCIAANGDVIPCAGWNGLVLGNVKEQSLSNIWLNSTRLLKLQEITEKDFTLCVNCDANKYCVRCMNRNYNECNKDIFCTPQHFCDIAHLLKKIIEESC